MKSPKTVYFVRHGQSEDNAEPIFQTYDSPLSSKGEAQALKIADRASHLSFDAIISSPQPRAKQTAEAIANTTGKQVEVSDLFLERIKPASVEGKSWGDPEANVAWREWEKSLTTPGLKVEDGENFEEIVARADKALAFLQDRNEDTLLVVSHGHFIRTIVARVMLGQDLTGERLKRFYELIAVENTGITILKYKDAFEEDFRWRVWSLNDHAHFAE